MSYGQQPARYRELEVMSLPPARRVVALYGHLLVMLRRAHLHIERGEIELRCERLLQAQEIVQELLVSLDHEAGGELAARLADIYAWLFTELTALNRTPDLARLAACTAVVTELHAAWEAAARELDAAGTVEGGA